MINGVEAADNSQPDNALCTCVSHRRLKTKNKNQKKKQKTFDLVFNQNSFMCCSTIHLACVQYTWKNVVFRHNPLLSPTWKHKLSLSTRCRGGIICSKYTGKLNLCITFGINKDRFMNNSALIGALLWRFPDLIDSFLWSKFWCAKFAYKSKTLHQKYIVAFFLFLLL